MSPLPCLLAVDAGNTSVTVGLFQGRRLARVGRLATAAALGRGGLGARLASCVGLGSPRGPVAAVVFASVVPALDRKLSAAAQDRFRCPVFAVTPRSRLGLPLAVKAPAEVGADRIVNALAARELVGAPSLVVDIGTAVTVDCVTEAGAYGGGAIMPGPGMAVDALRDHTAKLPYVEPRRVSRAIGRDTAECIRSGLYFGWLGMIRAVVEKTRSEMGGGRIPVIATGGWARLFRSGLGPDFCIMPDLTLEGLRLAYGILAGGGTRCR
ncbi:MAG: type III pantothenate kinase [Elusimicrobia bacterium]|nr:type III pantothenate kinase [Elusimicrobiota bacterium]